MCLSKSIDLHTRHVVLDTLWDFKEAGWKMEKRQQSPTLCVGFLKAKLYF